MFLVTVKFNSYFRANRGALGVGRCVTNQLNGWLTVCFLLKSSDHKFVATPIIIIVYMTSLNDSNLEPGFVVGSR